MATSPRRDSVHAGADTPRTVQLRAKILVDEQQRNDNLASWSKEQEEILKVWAIKAAGSRWLHDKAGRHYRSLNNKLMYPQIVLSTLAGVGGFSMTSSSADGTAMSMVIIGYFIAFINITTALLISLQKFIMAAEKSENHTAVSQQFSSFYRNITLELALNPKDRTNCLELCNACKDRYERLLQISPSVPQKIINEFKVIFKDIKHKPDIANGLSDLQIWTKTDSTKTDEAFIKMRAFYNLLYRTRNARQRRRVQSGAKNRVTQVSGAEKLSILVE